MISRLTAVIDPGCEREFGTCLVAQLDVDFSMQMTRKSAAWELSRKPVR